MGTGQTLSNLNILFNSVCVCVGGGGGAANPTTPLAYTMTSKLKFYTPNDKN